MAITSMLKCSLLTAAMAFSMAAVAQKPAAPAAPAAHSGDAGGVVWKKEIVRIIDMGKMDTSGHHVDDVSSENSLIDMFCNLIKGGKITAYSSSDHNFTSRLTMADFNKMSANHELNPESVHKYKILEEWSCYPATGKTEVQVMAIAPMKDAGETANVCFWLRFSDISAIMARYEQYHPNNTMAGKIWDDYFWVETRK
jgi:Gliding motility associated protein GldN